MTSSSVDGETRRVQAGVNDSGRRLDVFLAQAFPDISRSRLQALIADGRVRHAGAMIKDPAKRVKPEDEFEIGISPPVPAAPRSQSMALTIVYEDSDLIVVEKPAGLVVHPAAGNLDGTLVNALLAHCGDTLQGVGGVARPGIVHRLDKDTSGLLVAAKNERAMRSLAKQFAAHAVERAYHAVVWGGPHPRDGAIEGNLGRSPFDRKRMAVLRGQGKPARTHYRTLESFAARGTPGAAEAKPFASLVECRLETGRTHQIRVHLSYAGHPLVGDAVYGRARARPKARTPEEDAAYGAAIDFPRQALHAGVLGIFHPTRQETLRFTSPWPADFSNLVNALRTL